jgi:regulator of sirC expression with transglutaminase-like and TPR domain
VSILEPHVESVPAPSDASRRSTQDANARLTRAACASDEDRRIDLLIALLDDDSPTVCANVRRELARLAPQSVPALRRAATCSNARLRMRARALLSGLDRERVARRMIRFALRKEIDLERGLLLLSRFEEPRLDLRPTVLALDALAAEALRRIESARPTASHAQVLIDYLARDVGLRGDEADYHPPDNIYVHRALERRRGMPLTLAAIYVLVARRARIRAAGVALPGHVVLRLYDRGRALLIDAFHGGKPLSERDCLKYLAEHHLPFHPRWFDDSTDATLWVRHVRNLQASYARRGLAREVELLGAVLAARERA